VKDERDFMQEMDLVESWKHVSWDGGELLVAFQKLLLEG